MQRAAVRILMVDDHEDTSRAMSRLLGGMGYDGVADVRQGKYFELDVQAESPDAARAMVGEVSNRLLANPVIESYRVDLA